MCETNKCAWRSEAERAQLSIIQSVLTQFDTRTQQGPRGVKVKNTRTALEQRQGHREQYTLYLAQLCAHRTVLPSLGRHAARRALYAPPRSPPASELLHAARIGSS